MRVCLLQLFQLSLAGFGNLCLETQRAGLDDSREVLCCASRPKNKQFNEKENPPWSREACGYICTGCGKCRQCTSENQRTTARLLRSLFLETVQNEQIWNRQPIGISCRTLLYRVGSARRGCIRRWCARSPHTIDSKSRR